MVFMNIIPMKNGYFFGEYIPNIFRQSHMLIYTMISLHKTWLVVQCAHLEK